MGTEIERKFLVKNWEFLTDAVSASEIVQGYVTTRPPAIVRIRTYGDEAFLTLKGMTKGASRSEFEYQIPLADAQAMLDEFVEGETIEKTRYIVEHEGSTWEVDVFGGLLNGLVLAEIELEDEDADFKVPGWVGCEVTYDSRFRNSEMVDMVAGGRLTQRGDFRLRFDDLPMLPERPSGIGPAVSR